MQFNIYLFLMASGVNYIAKSFLFVGMSWLIYDYTSSPQLLVVYFLVNSILGIIWAPIAGSIVTNHNKKHVLLFTALGQAILGSVILFGLIFNVKQYVFFLSLGFLINIIDRLFWPAQSVVVKILFIENILKLNSYTNIINQGGYVLGAGLAGILVFHFGMPALFMSYCLSLLLSFAFIYFIKYSENVIETSDLVVKKRIFQNFVSVKNGFGYIFKENMLLTLITLQSALFATLHIMNVLLPIFVNDFNHMSIREYGFIDSSWAVGAVLGGFVSAIFIKKNISINYILIIFVIMGFNIVLFSFSRNLSTLVMLYTFIGAFFVINRVIIDTKIQLSTETKYLALTKGNITSINSITQILSYFLILIIITPENIQLGYFFAFTLLILSCILCLCIRKIVLDK